LCLLRKPRIAKARTPPCQRDGSAGNSAYREQFNGFAVELFFVTA